MTTTTTNATETTDTFRADMRAKLEEKIADLKGWLSISSMSSHPWRVATEDGTVLKSEKDGTTRLGFDGLAGYACFTNRKAAQRLADAWNAATEFKVRPMTEREVKEVQLRGAESMLAMLNEA